MFKLKLPVHEPRPVDDDAEHYEIDNNEHSYDDNDSLSSRSLMDFGEDDDSERSAPASSDEDEELLELDTMEAVFDDATKQLIRDLEADLNTQDEEWLQSNGPDADQDAIAAELAEREIKNQKKLYHLRRQKFYELGGRKQTRQLMMRYGITHLKLLKEQHDAAGGHLQDAVETHPRSVANSLLRRLRYGDELLRIDWLKELFMWLRVRQKEDTDNLKFGSAPQTEQQPERCTELSSPSERSPVVGLTSPTLETATLTQQLDMSGSLPVSPAIHSPAGLAERFPGSCPAQTEPLRTVGSSSQNQQTNSAYMKRQQRAAAQPHQQVTADSVLVEAEKRVPSHAVGENLFVRGCRCFFEQLKVHDDSRRVADARRLREDRRQALQNQHHKDALRQGAGHEPSGSSAVNDAYLIGQRRDAEAAEAAKREMEAMRAKEELFERVKAILTGSAEAAAEVNNDAPAEGAVGSRGRSPVSQGDVSEHFASSVVADDSVLDNDEDDDVVSLAASKVGASGGDRRPIGGDFLTRSAEIVDAGFRFLFSAVDALENGYITWDPLVEYLLDATIQGRVDQRQDLESRDYEFVLDHHTLNISDLNDACMIPSRDILAVAGTHVTLMSNKVATKFVERHGIRSPLDPFTLVPQYRVTAVAVMTSVKMLAVATSNSVVSVYSIGSVSKPRFVSSYRVDSNAKSLLWFRDLLFVGTRVGSLFSLRVQRVHKGLALRLAKQTSPHLSFITRIIAIPTESCICTCALDKTMVMHDAKSLKQVFSFRQEHLQGIIDMCYCDCINGIASVSFDNRILVWMVSLPQNRPIPLLDSVRPHIGTLSSVAVIEHSRSLVTLDSKGMAKIWGLKALNCVQTLTVGSYAPVSDAYAKFFRVIVHHCPPSVVLPLGSTQLFVLSRRRLYVFEYNLSQRGVILRNTADDDPVVYVGYNYVEQLYVTFSLRTVRIWEASTGNIRDSYRCPEIDVFGGISAATLHPNGRSYYVGTHRGAIVAKNFSTGTTLYVIRCHTSGCIALRFAYAATMPARVGTTLSASQQLAESVNSSATGAKRKLMTKAGLGDIVITIADDSMFVLTNDFKSKLTLDGIDNPRCLDHDSQSSLILVGDAFGSISVYLQVNLSGQRNLPYQVIQLPKRIPHEITALTVMHGLSAFVAVDDEGAMGLFSLKHHPRPFTCVGVWSFVSDSAAGGSAVSCMHFYHAKWLLYCGDELGNVVVFQLRDAFLLSQGSVSSLASPLSVSTRGNTLRAPRGVTPTSSPRVAMRVGKGATPRGGAPAFLQSPVAADAPPRKRTAVVSDSSDNDFRSVGAAVVLINRFQPHLEAVTSILVVSPENSTLGADAMLVDDPVAAHTVLLTTSVDQCCCSWKLGGTVHLGSLEQYGRCRVAITSPTSADDLRVLQSKRDSHQMDARRDTIKLRSRGLIRKAMTSILSTIPARFLPKPKVVVSGVVDVAPDIASPVSARSDASMSFTPRSARQSRLQQQAAVAAGGDIIMHPEVPTRTLMSAQEYAKNQSRQRKSLKQLASDAPTVTKASIAALDSSAGATMRSANHDPDTLSQMLSEYASSDYNSVLDEIFSVHSGAFGTMSSVTGKNMQMIHDASSRRASVDAQSVSTTATSLLQRDGDHLLVKMQGSLQPSTASVNKLYDGKFSVTCGTAERGVNEIKVTHRMLATQHLKRASRHSRSTQATGLCAADEDDRGSVASSMFSDDASGGDRLSTAGGTHRPSSGSITRAGSFGEGSCGGTVIPVPVSARSSLSASTRPVVIETSYIAETKTTRSASVDSSRKDPKLGYHNGTLERYRRVSAVTKLTAPVRQRPNSAAGVSNGGAAKSQRTPEEYSIVIETTQSSDAATTLPTLSIEVQREAFLQSKLREKDRKSPRRASPRVSTFDSGTAAEHSSVTPVEAPSIVLSRECLEHILPQSPLREGLIQLLLNYGPAIRSALRVECTSRHKTELLRQLVFQNRKLKDISHDCLVEQKVNLPTSCAAAMARPGSAPPVVGSAREQSCEVTSTAGLVVSTWDAFWETYHTTMSPPPPDFLDRRIKYNEETRKPPVPKQRRVASAGLGVFCAPVVTDDVTNPQLISRVASIIRPSTATSLLADDLCEVPQQSGPVASRSAMQYLLRHRTAESHRHGFDDSLQQQASRLAKGLDTMAYVDRPACINCADSVALPRMPSRAQKKRRKK